MSTPILESLPPEEAFMVILHRLHNRWRLAILLPLLYVMTGIALQRYAFAPGWKGLFVAGDEWMLAGLFIGGSSVAILWQLLGQMNRRELDALAGARGDADQFLKLAKDHQMLQFLICDIVSFPGIILFFMTGDLFLLVIFAVLSMLFYLRSFPSDRRLGEVMFRPERGR